jgi:hypothetical protein
MNIIDTLKFENFSIQLNDLIVEQSQDGNVYITDGIVSLEEFESFIAFYHHHNDTGKYFNIVLDNKGFYGRFGQLVYSKGETNYLIRLVFVESKNDTLEDNQKSFAESVVTIDASYLNLRNLVAKQELIINQLRSVLESKNILTATEINEVFNVSEEKINEVKFEMATRVKDLEQYLKDQKDTMNDIRSSKD